MTPAARVLAVEVVPLRIPFRTAFAHSSALRRESRPQLVRLRLSDGTLGHGEALPRPYLTGEDEASVQAAFAACLPRLVLGAELQGLEDARALLERPEAERARRAWPAAFCGLELALFDAAGRFSGRSAASVLGPPLRTRLVFDAAAAGFMPLPALRFYLAQLRLKAPRSVKLKVGLPDDEARVGLARELLGERTQLILDANGAWTPDEAITRIRALERFEPELIEQPVAGRDLAGFARVARAVGTPLMADESLCTLDDARELLARKACGAFNLRVGKCGGLVGTWRLLRLAREAGLECQLGVLVGESAVLGAAGRLFAACAPGLARLEHDGGALKRADVHDLPCGREVEVPVNLPGLGLELDARRVEALRDVAVRESPASAAL